MPWTGSPHGRLSHFQRGTIYWSPSRGATLEPSGAAGGGAAGGGAAGGGGAPKTEPVPFNLHPLPLYLSEGFRWYRGAYPGSFVFKGEILSVNVPSGTSLLAVCFLRPGKTASGWDDPSDPKRSVCVQAGRSLTGADLALFTGTPAKSIDVTAAPMTNTGVPAPTLLMLSLTVTVP